MSERKNNKSYTFTVEGSTEKWYLDWLQARINERAESLYSVTIDAKVLQSPYKFAKQVNPIAVPYAIHICDYESSSDDDVQKFHEILNQLHDANKIKGKSFKYRLGYNNLTFELWMVLNKAECNRPMTNKTQYLEPINRAYDEKFESLKEYKQEKNFKRCLSKLTLENVKEAVSRSKAIMKNNSDNDVSKDKYKGFTYYRDNPSLTMWESVEMILKDCKLV